MNSPHFPWQEARQIDLIEYLEKLGYQPQKIRNDDYWYLSPLREEKEPSFKVNRKLNAWYDFGLGQGGNILDFGMLYHNCSFKEVMERLSNSFSFHPQTPTVQQHHTKRQGHRDAVEPKIKVIAAKPLSNLSLCSYLRQRKIPYSIAKNYCVEVHYDLNGKRFFAIGFKNSSGGYELRNAHFKGSSSPKDVTLIKRSSTKEIAVFEGFFSFLSYQAIHQKHVTGLTNFLVLNSLSFFEKSRQLMEENQKVQLYLDRDDAGKKHTQMALQWNQKYTDRSDLYKNHKDLNDFLLEQKQQQNQAPRVRRHL